MGEARHGLLPSPWLRYHTVASLWRQMRCHPCSRDSLAVFGRAPGLRERCCSITGCEHGTQQCHDSLEREETGEKKTQILTKGSFWKLVSDGNGRLWFPEMGIKRLPHCCGQLLEIRARSSCAHGMNWAKWLLEKIQALK